MWFVEYLFQLVILVGVLSLGKVVMIVMVEACW